jgi:hypothetical protein
MSLQVFQCEQGSADWYSCRLGIPTASKFKDVLAKGEGKTRKRYMLDLAGERLTGEPAEGFTNAYMERGKLMEDEARGLPYVAQPKSYLRIKKSAVRK